MIRLIIKKRLVDLNLGRDEESYVTIDVDLPEVEELLGKGCVGETGLDSNTFVGLEVLGQVPVKAVRPCPICDRNPLDAEIKHKTNGVLALTEGFQFVRNSGGAKFIFERIARLQVSDMCNWCDHEKIKAHVFRELKIFDAGSQEYPTGSKHSEIMAWARTKGYEKLWSNGRLQDE